MSTAKKRDPKKWAAAKARAKAKKLFHYGQLSSKAKQEAKKSWGNNGKA